MYKLMDKIVKWFFIGGVVVLCLMSGLGKAIIDVLYNLLMVLM